MSEARRGIRLFSCGFLEARDETEEVELTCGGLYLEDNRLHSRYKQRRNTAYLHAEYCMRIHITHDYAFSLHTASGEVPQRFGCPDDPSKGE